MHTDSSRDTAPYKLLALLAVAVVSAVVQCYGIGKWPWDHDEVYSLVELGYRAPPAEGVPLDQVGRLPRLVPAWYEPQRLVLRWLPHNEWGTRVLSVCSGIFTSVLAFGLARRHYGSLFAWALVLLLNGSQFFVWLVQQNRFYSTALLFLVLTLAAVWSRGPGVASAVLCAVFSALAVLSHNLLVAVFGLGFIAACAGFALGLVPRQVLLRCGIAAAVGALIYVFYLRPIMQGWVSGGTGGTNVLVSFVAQVGVPTLALALFGGALALVTPEGRQAMAWWAFLLVLSLLFVACSPLYLPAWNPRYGFLFMAPFWALGAYAVQFLARRMPSRALAAAVYGLVALLLLPKLASHYQDGSRHDFRQAAAVVKGSADGTETVLCNWPETLEYYLPASTGLTVRSWDSGRAIPTGACFIVYGSNAWGPPIRLPGRCVELVAQVQRRRFDEQSHVVSVYRVGPATTSAESSPAEPAAGKP